ncbi:inositol monophosphatase family protein [Hoyosella rhizosphaerae]|nr:inositol monophosphatase family protein [Hoyosella rhizosphaerae]MBN4925576.1 inositol monophosphatase family protein [Hoyosella rhizosphaerae]
MELVVVASAILDDASSVFTSGRRAPQAVRKGDRDFATEIDLSLEREITAALIAQTGIGVHGEEFGGQSISEGLVWVLDPVDGTLNYSAGLPYAAILLALLDDGIPVAGLTWLPIFGERMTATAGGPVLRNGLALPALSKRSLANSIIGVGSFNLASTRGFTGQYRLDVIGEISRQSSRIRMLGATGADFAYVATGALGGALSFGHHVWDHAAGAALVAAAGGEVTDLSGRPWTVHSRSMLAAAPGVHAELLDVIHSVTAA